MEAAIVLTADPALLRELVERCEMLSRRLASGGSADTARQLEDSTYTRSALCVVTGIRQMDAALYVARRQLADAMAREQPSAAEQPARSEPGHEAWAPRPAF
jgi:hypothetical protein